MGPHLGNNLLVARMGKFSSDRSIGEYCGDIWHITPLAAKEGRG